MYPNTRSYNHKISPLLTTLILLTAVIATAMSIPLAFAAPTVATDKPTYLPGEAVSVNGTATPNSIISIQLFNPDGLRVAIAQAKADANGAYSKANVYTFKETDITGIWTVKTYQGGISAEVTITLEGAAPPVVDTTAPKLTISINPSKTLYKAERIRIEVAGNEELSAVTIDVTQKDASAAALLPSAAIEDASKWSGTYSLTSGYDGKATIRVLAKDLAGNSAETSQTFTVDTTPPTVTVTAPSRTENPTITISGTVDDPTLSSISIEVAPATPIPVDVLAGKWSTEVTLTATGTNTLLATATDAAGNTGKSSAAVIYVGTLEVLVDRVEKLGFSIDTLESTVTNELSDTSSSISSELSSTSTALTGEMADLNSSIKAEISNLSTLIIVAVILSLIAAIFAIFSVVTITRKIVLK